MRSKSDRPKHASVYLRDIVPGSSIPPAAPENLTDESLTPVTDESTTVITDE